MLQRVLKILVLPSRPNALSITKEYFFFGVLLTVDLSIYISLINQLDAQNFENITILFWQYT